MQQAMPPERLDRKGKIDPIRPRYALGFQINSQLHTGLLSDLGKPVYLLMRQDNRQQAILETVVKKDIGEAGRDNAPDSKVCERPGRMLAARPAAEIRARNEYPGGTKRGLIEHERRNFPPVFVETHLMKQVLAEPRALRRRKELLGNNRVRIDINHRHRRGHARELREFLHGNYTIIAIQHIIND